MNFALSWFRIKKIAVVDERVQTGTYSACSVLADMLDSPTRSRIRRQGGWVVP